MTPKPPSQKPSTLGGFMRGLGIGAILVLGIIGLYLCLFWLANPPTPLLPDKCSLPPGIYCEDHRVEIDEIQFLIQNGMGKDLILKKVVVTETSPSPLHLCEMTSGEIAIPNGESAIVTADNCIIKDILPEYNYKYDLDFTIQFVDSGEEHTVRGELFTGRGVPGERQRSRLPTGTILTALILLAYILVIRWLWKHIMKDEPKRERLICLCAGIICSPAVIALIIGGIMLVGIMLVGDVGAGARLGAAVGIILLVTIFTQTPRLITRIQKHRDFIKGIWAYALILGLLHFFALIVWYFWILESYQ